MANGDDAAAAGLTVFSGTQDRRQGYDNDNIRGDDIAHVIAKLPTVSATAPTSPEVGDLWFW